MCIRKILCKEKSLLSVKKENQKFSSLNAIFEMPRLSKIKPRKRCVGVLSAGMSQNAVATTFERLRRRSAFFGDVSRPLNLLMTSSAVEDLE